MINFYTITVKISFKNLGEVLWQGYDHLSEQRVCPGKPISSDACRSVDWKRLVIKVIERMSFETLQAISNLTLIPGCQYLSN